MEKKSKELIILPLVSDDQLDNFLADLNGEHFLYIDPSKLKDKFNFKTIFESPEADYVVCNNRQELIDNISLNKTSGLRKRILSNNDIDDLMESVKLEASFIIVDVEDWKIIPLENIISRLHKFKTKIFAVARNLEEVRTLFTVLEVGVDGVILETNKIQDVRDCQYYFKNPVFTISVARIVEIRESGIGERVCVDTVSMLKNGEGMLIGSKSNFFFLVHNESVGSSFTSPRPFRVNAGAIYCYTLMPEGNTKYLSELEAGSEILIVDKNGASRRSTVGRAKIETRPLLLIRAKINNDEYGTIILQNAETIRLINKEGIILPVTSAKVGDEILVCVNSTIARHFGVEVNEYILEK